MPVPGWNTRKPNPLLIISRCIDVSMSLKSELQEINGVGEATAQKIIEVVESNESESDVAGNVRTAYEYLQDGQEHQAHEYLERAYEGL